jgi:hypothetical protein
MRPSEDLSSTPVCDMSVVRVVGLPASIACFMDFGRMSADFVVPAPHESASDPGLRLRIASRPSRLSISESSTASSTRADKFFCDEEINRIAVVAPNVKLNIIRDYEVVEKREVNLPDELCGIVKCANPKCITNNEPMPTLFHVVDKENCVIKCHYCEKEQTREDIEII